MDLLIRLKDILPGLVGSLPKPSAGAALGNQLFFTARDLTNGEELWITDGTIAGTRLVKDITPGAIGSYPSELTIVGNRLYFQANDGSTGQELWTSDGTTTGTRLVRDLRQGVPQETMSSSPTFLRALGSQLLFWADDGVQGRALWGADDSGQMRLIKNVRPGSSSNEFSSDILMTVVNTAAGQRFFFSADDGVGGNDLWVSDGTNLGTKVVLDMTSGENNFSTPTQASGQLFFMLNQQQLWSSNGTPEGTTIHWGFSGFGNNILNVIDDKIFIESVDSGGNKQLWTYNVAVHSAQQLTTFDNNPSELTFESERATVGKNFFFSAASSSHGTELWVTDGTTVGTRLVKDIRSGSAGSNPRGFIAARGRLYFWADDGANGVELWRSDGTTGGTSIVADLKPGPEGSIAEMGFFDDSSKVVGDKLVFSANDGTTGPALWALTLPDPTPPTLALSALSASKAEGRAGATPFTFQVGRSGNSSGVANVRWAVAGVGSTAATASDFGSSTLPSGTVSFAAGQTRQTITVNVAGDLGKETDETFRVTLSGATGATITTATANGTILNDDLIGDGNRNRLVGTARAEFIDGRANLDTLTGGAAADVFGFRFGESRLSAPDAITDFAFGTDKIDLFAASGGTLPAPARFSRAANNGSAKTLAALSTAVFTDANGARSGNQALGGNGAALVRATHAAIAGTYLVINNSVAGRSDSDDLMIKLNGFTGPLPAIGTVGVGTVFV